MTEERKDAMSELSESSEVQYIGPFEAHDVVVGGYRVPGLVATPRNGGVVSFTYDNRFSLDLEVQTAERAVPFIADCIAVALGYTCHPRVEYGPPKARTPFAPVSQITTEDQ